MSLFTEANVRVLIADYIGIDAAMKINAIGANFSIAGVQPNGFSAPQHVLAMVDVPGKYAGQQFSFSLELRNQDAGTVVSLPGPQGAESQALRVQQLVLAEQQRPQGMYVPDTFPCRAQIALAMEGGFPSSSGRATRGRSRSKVRRGPAGSPSSTSPTPPCPSSEDRRTVHPQTYRRSTRTLWSSAFASKCPRLPEQVGVRGRAWAWSVEAGVPRLDDHRADLDVDRVDTGGTWSGQESDLVTVDGGGVVAASGGRPTV